jgi:hypothetical protein
MEKKMNIRVFILFAVSILSFSCSGRKMYGEENPGFEILRFDKDLYQYLTNNEPDSDLKKYAGFLDVFGERVINIGKSDSLDFSGRLKKYFSEPTLMGLYNDELKVMNDISLFNSELSQGFHVFSEHFPLVKHPQVYMHVSGLNQNVIVTDEILSLSADKYLGSDYPLYQEFFYDYQRQLMSPDRIVPDYLLGFMMANFPFKGNEDILLDRILYEGKLRYLLSRLLPDRQIWEYVAYNKEQYMWCSNNQSQIWKTILENQHLFTANYLTTAQYLKEAPHTAFLPVESPGRAGIWLGYQIIIAYMKQNPNTSLQQLMEITDYRELLKQSKYKP